MKSNLANLFLGVIVILSEITEAFHLNQIKTLSQDKPVKLMSDVEFYVIMSAPTRHTKIKEHELIPAWRILQKGKFPAKTPTKYRQLMKKDLRKRPKKLPAKSDRGSSTVLKNFPFMFLF